MPLGALSGRVAAQTRARTSGRLALLALSLAATSAFGDVTKDQCIDSNGRAQSLRRGGKFSAAREQLRTCSDPTCPRIIRDDCVRRLDDLDHVQPTIVFEAKDASGRDLAAVKVTMDGQALADRLNGAALAVDPGEHAFTFEVAGQPPTTETFVVHEADKSRREVVVIGAPLPTIPSQGAAGAPTPGPTGVEAPPPKGGGPRKAIGFTLAGLGVAGLGLGSFFGIQAMSKNSDAGCDAQNHCANGASRIDAQHAANAATLAFVAGGAFLTGGLVLVLLAPRASNTAAATLQLTPWLGVSGGGGAAFAGVW